MKNIFALLYKHHLLLLFLFLEILSLVLVVQHNVFQHSAFVSSASRVSGSTYEVVNDVSDYLSLREKNALLADSLARLKTQSLCAFMKQDTHRVKFYDTLYKQQYIYEAARVIHMSLHKPNNYITIDRGSADGVKENMAVIGVNGIVGIVNGTTPNYSSVLTILHNKTELPCKLKSTRDVGFLKWNNRDYDAKHALLTSLPFSAKVKKGDTVVSTEYSKVYPSGVPIGKVLESRIADDGQSVDVSLELFIDFNKLDHVFVVHDLMKEQKDSLVNKFQRD